MVNTAQGLFLGLANDEIIRMLVRDRAYEPHLLEVFDRFVNPGDVVIDVGANVGYHTVQLAKRVGANGRVYAVEPQLLMYRFLAANCLLNNQFNVTSIHGAAGNVSGVLTLAPIDYWDSDLNSGCGRISSNGECVNQFRLDSLELHLSPKFIKIDAQAPRVRIVVP